MKRLPSLTFKLGIRHYLDFSQLRHLTKSNDALETVYTKVHYGFFNKFIALVLSDDQSKFFERKAQSHSIFLNTEYRRHTERELQKPFGSLANVPRCSQQTPNSYFEKDQKNALSMFWCTTVIFAKLYRLKKLCESV